MKLTLPTSKPRNPFVRAAYLRRAGSHRKPAKAERLAHRHALSRALASAHDIDP